MAVCLTSYTKEKCLLIENRAHMFLHEFALLRCEILGLLMLLNILTSKYIENLFKQRTINLESTQ